ncbi:hypothetical protein Lal_00027029 [Lupinus albus]|nr:hypothetical protein Lal_00027029 [Lupinus albus]
MWDTLQVTHEGTSKVKRARLNALSHEYELFCMFPHESICDMQKRFTHIVNHLVALDKVFAIGELTNKVLRCLSRKWQPKVTAIMESKYVDSMSLATLFVKLQEHEMEIQRLTLHEQTNENVKRISFKATKSHSRSQEVRSDHEKSDSDIDDETVSHLVNKFRKFLRKKGGFRKFHKEDVKDSIKKSKNPKDNTSFHECGKVGHMKYTCPTYLKRIEHRNKKDYRDIKAIEAYIIWDEPEEDTTSTSTSEDEESSKICLVVQNLNSCQESEQDESSEVNSSDSSSNFDNSPSYDILYGAYVEMHEELKKLAKKYMNKKMLILEHEKEISELQFLIDELNLENETLDLINANSSCNCTTKLSETPTCENFKVLNAENSVLKNKFAKFTYSSHNLDNILDASRNVGNRSGLGYMHAKKSKSNMNQVVYAKMSHQKLPTCFYCGLHGHTSISCKVKMHGIPSGQYMWIQNGQVPLVTNKKEPNITWVPKTCK